MNTFEDLAAGVRIGFIDDDFAYALESDRLVSAWQRFSSYAEARRRQLEADELFIELENVATRWAARAKKEASARNQARLQNRAKMGIVKPKG